MGNVSIDLSLSNIWKSWYRFRSGKKASIEIDQFSYHLESNLQLLHKDLNEGTYKHGPHRKVIITDNKRREISVAHIRDRVVHRLLYDYLTKIYDKTFIYDAWSCRKNKGLIGAIERAQTFLSRYPNSFVWRTDITKFFDSVDRKVLLCLLAIRIKDDKAYLLMKEIIESYAVRHRLSLSLSLSLSRIASSRATIHLRAFQLVT